MQNLIFQPGQGASAPMTIPTTDDLITRLNIRPEGTECFSGGPRALQLQWADTTLHLQWSADLMEVHVARESDLGMVWEGPLSDEQARAWVHEQLRPLQRQGVRGMDLL